MSSISQQRGQVVTGNLMQWLKQSLSIGLVIAALVAIATWGHRHEWTLPKFSALVGGTAQAEAAWCGEHNVPEAICVECKPDLDPRGEDFGWCAEHGVAQCPFEHPEAAQLKVRPEVTPAMRERAARALATKPRAENNSLCPLHVRRVQFASVQAVEKAGIDIALVQERPVVEAVLANGEVIYDQNRMAHLSSRVGGSVWHVAKQVGDRVQKGDCLALIEAADIGKAKSELLQAIAQLRLRQATLGRLQPLSEAVVAARQMREAETSLQEANIRLLAAEQGLANLGLAADLEALAKLDLNQIARSIQLLGLTAGEAAALSGQAATSNLLPIRAPLDGVVIERDVVAGEVVDSSRVLFAVADVSRLWLTLNVREEDAKYISIGLPVLFRPSHAQNEPEVRGSVAWISTSTDSHTRTVQVRVELVSDSGKLRANTFGTGRIVLREEPTAMVLPTESIHSDGNCQVVFVRDKDYFSPTAPKTIFHVRAVRLGVRIGDTTEVIAGVLPGEVVASKNSAIIEAQLLKSNLGAGCACAQGH